MKLSTYESINIIILLSVDEAIYLYTYISIVLLAKLSI